MMTSMQALNEISGAGGQVLETTDSRETLEQFRRLGLYIILQHNGHDHIDESMPYEKMLAYAKAHEEDLNLEGLTITKEPYGGFSVRKPKELSEDEREFDKKIQAKRKEWDGAGWEELKSVAFANNIDITRMQEKEVIMNFVDAGIERRDLNKIVPDKGSLPAPNDVNAPAHLDNIATNVIEMKYHDLVKYAKGKGVAAQGMKKAAILEALAA